MSPNAVGAPAVRQMIEPAEALQRVVEAASPLEPQLLQLKHAVGLQLAEDVRAEEDLPPFPRAMMDGYAVRTSDAGRAVEVSDEIPAGRQVERSVVAGSCFRIMTGAPCPPGTEAVVAKEHVRQRGERVVLPEKIPEGWNIAPQGSECRRGNVALRAGETLRPLAVAALASLGLESVRVRPRPSLAILTTGAELVAPGTEPGPAQIRDSNGPMLEALARDLGIEQPLRLHAEDRLEALLDALEQAAAADVVMLTGGVSAGEYDLVPQALVAHGVELVFHRVKQKPGKPMLFARRDAQLFFGLPGNPLASHLGFCRYVAAAVRRMMGKPAIPAAGRGELSASVAANAARTYFLPALAERVEEAATGWRVHPLPGVSSADVFAPHRADCYVELPPGSPALPAGQVVSFAWIGAPPTG